MTGGVAYVYDPDTALAAYVNPESITLRTVPDTSAGRLKELLQAHVERTASPRAQAILDDWEHSRAAFIEVMPNEILALQEKQQSLSA